MFSLFRWTMDNTVHKQRYGRVTGEPTPLHHFCSGEPIWHLTCFAILSGYKGYNYNDIESMQVRSQITTPLPSSYNKFQLWTHPHTIHTHSQYTHAHTHTHTHVHTHNTHTHTHYTHTHTCTHTQYTHMHPHALQYISRNSVV